MWTGRPVWLVCALWARPAWARSGPYGLRGSRELNWRAAQLVNRLQFSANWAPRSSRSHLPVAAAAAAAITRTTTALETKRLAAQWCGQIKSYPSQSNPSQLDSSQLWKWLCSPPVRFALFDSCPLPACAPRPSPSLVPAKFQLFGPLSHRQWAEPRQAAAMAPRRWGATSDEELK